MKYLGIDYGEKRIGLAGSFAGIIVKPLEVVQAKDSVKLFSQLIERVKFHQPENIVIGLPVDSDGNIQSQAKKVQIFAESISMVFPKTKIYFTNEYLSSFEAKTRSTKKTKNPIDDIAAAVILEQFLKEQSS